MNAKQQAIKNAYGEYWEQVKNLVRKDGSLRESVWRGMGIDIPYQDYSTGYFRPNSIIGIETNNDWIRIENESDLPNDYDRSNFKLNYWTNQGFYDYKSYTRWSLIYDDLKITHYQLIPITQPKQPIY